MKFDGLNYRQSQFVIAYVKSRNATQAAKDAGYSQKTAGAIGHENLNKPKIKQAIKQYFKENAMDDNEALSILADMARNKDDKYSESTQLGALKEIAKALELTTKTQIDFKDVNEAEWIAEIKAGTILYEDALAVLQDEQLANQLFKKAGVTVHVNPNP